MYARRPPELLDNACTEEASGDQAIRRQGGLLYRAMAEVGRDEKDGCNDHVTIKESTTYSCVGHYDRSIGKSRASASRAEISCWCCC